jgi:serine protease inhibitor
MLTLMSRADMPTTVIDNKLLLKDKTKKMLDDIKQSHSKSTELRHANGYLVQNHYPEEDLKLMAADLPNFRR